MKSMTGFGFSEIQDERTHISLDLKSYNNRYLDIITNIPTVLNPLEPELREWLSTRISRGRVEVHIRYRELEENLKVILDENVVNEYTAVLNQIASLAGIDEKPGLSHLLAMEGIIKTDRKRDISTIRDKIFPMLEKAFIDFDTNRDREGANTEKTFWTKLPFLKRVWPWLKGKFRKWTILFGKLFEQSSGKLPEMRLKRLASLRKRPCIS